VSKNILDNETTDPTLHSRKLLIYDISLFHGAFFNSIIDKTPTHALFHSTLY